MWFQSIFSSCGHCDFKSVSLVSVYQSQTSGFPRHLLVSQCPLLQRGIVIVQPNVHRFVKKKERQFCFFWLCVFYSFTLPVRELLWNKSVSFVFSGPVQHQSNWHWLQSGSGHQVDISGQLCFSQSPQIGGKNKTFQVNSYNACL